MILPEIPIGAIAAAVRQYETYGSNMDDALEAAWPHLYAAALRHAAERMDGDWPDENWAAECLRRIAAEAVSSWT